MTEMVDKVFSRTRYKATAFAVLIVYSLYCGINYDYNTPIFCAHLACILSVSIFRDLKERFKKPIDCGTFIDTHEDGYDSPYKRLSTLGDL